MRVICAKCGQGATVRETPNGYSYAPDGGAMLRCPIVKERIEEEGNRTNATDCDYLQEAVQSLADRQRGTVVSQSPDEV